MERLARLLPFAAVALWACSSELSIRPPRDEGVSEPGEVAEADALDEAGDPGGEEQAAEVAEGVDAEAAEGTDGTPDTRPDSHLGDRCDTDHDCPEDAVCYGDPGCNARFEDCDRRCVDPFTTTMYCVVDAGGCPPGWQCAEVQGSMEEIAICLPPSAYCRPCKVDADCQVPGWADSLCVDAGPSGRACGVPCVAACPEGATCREAQGTGKGAKQCVPASFDSCPCTPDVAAIETSCYRQNEAGRCHGTRTCTTPCDAPEASFETCNGLDDDCDGKTDVETDPARTGCPDLGVCAKGMPATCGAGGKWECHPDQLEGWAGDDPCEGGDCLDNDCDGLTDEDSTGDCCFFDHCGRDPACDCDGIPDSLDNCDCVSNPGQEDLDVDGVGDACDPDPDGDLLEGADNCPMVANVGQEDLDDDGEGDACDADDDGDGTADAADNCPRDPNPGQEDSNKNGVGDACDPCVCPDPAIDTDGDGTCDACDADDDGDDVPDGEDNCRFVANTDQGNADGDGQGDACDCDADEDGVPNMAIECPLCAPCDNCPLTPNPDQTPSCNELGAACNPDTDCDGEEDATDCAPLDPGAHHGGTEACNGMDDDCNGGTDEEGAEGCKAWFVDLDLDGWGVAPGKCLCRPDGTHVTMKLGDCMDADPRVHPGLVEDECPGQGDGVDEDCDGTVDESVRRHPGAREMCNGVDDDCDGVADDADAADMCQDPPAPACDGSERVTHVPSCPAGACVYTPVNVPCENGCEGGSCRADRPPLPGELAVTELMLSPSAGNLGHWIEVRNVTEIALDLTGVRVRTIGAALVAEYVFPATPRTVIQGKTERVLVRSADPLANGGVTGGIAFSDMVLVPAGGSVELIGADGKTIDLVAWDATWPVARAPSPGRSMALSPAVPVGTEAAGNDVAGHWCLGQWPWVEGGADLGSPGERNPACRPDSCGLLGPAATSTVEGHESEPVRGIVVVTGLTDASDRSPLILAEAGYGPHGTVPDGAWLWFLAEPEPGVVGEPFESFARPLPTVGAGLFNLAYRVSIDGGLTWTLCDANGSEDGYDPGTAGVLSVKPAGVFFSEYVEGTGNTRALEIHNATARAFGFSQCRIELYLDGVPTATNVPLGTATVAPGGSLVACNPAAPAAVLAKCQVKDGLLNFSGDDAIVLRCGGKVMDSVGQVGMDPGTAWGVGQVTTADHTLRRKAAVFAGRSDPGAPFDPAIEWEGFPADTVDGLGQHQVVLGDLDADGVVFDNCPAHANSDQSDVDLDGAGDACDNCPANFNPDQADLDGDGTGDACDPVMG